MPVLFSVKVVFYSIAVLFLSFLDCILVLILTVLSAKKCHKVVVKLDLTWLQVRMAFQQLEKRRILKNWLEKCNNTPVEIFLHILQWQIIGVVSERHLQLEGNIIDCPEREDDSETCGNRCEKVVNKPEAEAACDGPM